MSIALRLKFFDAMVTSLVGFAAGHRRVQCGWVTKSGWTLLEIATAHGWTTTGYHLERTMAWHLAWVAHPHITTIGMQWIQNMVAQIFDEVLKICKLCRVGLAPTTRENRTNIYHLGLAIATFCSMAPSWRLDNHSHGLMPALFECLSVRLFWNDCTLVLVSYTAP